MSGGNRLPNLDKIFKDDEKIDFPHSNSSNLANIFAAHERAENIGSQTLKKSKNNASSGQVSPKMEVLIAKVVYAYKLKQGQYVPVGKLGMALVGNAVTKLYQIILYKTKQEHLSTVNVTPDFLYTVQANNYSSYYDANKDNWSILFENNEICIEFAREIGLARYFSKETRTDTQVLYQDLTICDKTRVAEQGDSVTVKYFISTDITQPFPMDSLVFKNMTVEISMDDNWEKTLLATGKGLRRVLFLPTTKQISLGPGFPREKDVFLEIEIIDINTLTNNVSVLKPLTSAKASIISRMAKMGQPILPKFSTSTTTDSDTEEDLPKKVMHHKKVELGEKHLSQDSSDGTTKNVHRTKSKTEITPIESSYKKPLITTIFSPQWSPTHTIQPHCVTLDGQPYTLQPQNCMDPNLSMLVSETRIANSETRMGLTKIADNVQKLLDKFHVLELQNATNPTHDKTIETALKMFLNERKPIENCDSKEDNESRKDVIRTNEDEIMKIKEEKLILEKMYEELSERTKELKISLDESNDKLQQITKHRETTEELINVVKKENSNLNERVANLLQEKRVLEDTLSNMRNSNDKDKEIKYIMNKTYHTLVDRFTNESYSTDYIKSTIAKTIKHVTLQVLTRGCDKESNTSTESRSSKNLLENVMTMDQNKSPPQIPPMDSSDSESI